MAQLVVVVLQWALDDTQKNLIILGFHELLCSRAPFFAGGEKKESGWIGRVRWKGQAERIQRTGDLYVVAGSVIGEVNENLCFFRCFAFAFGLFFLVVLLLAACCLVYIMPFRSFFDFIRFLYKYSFFFLLFNMSREIVHLVIFLIIIRKLHK